MTSIHTSYLQTSNAVNSASQHSTCKARNSSGPLYETAKELFCSEHEARPVPAMGGSSGEGKGKEKGGKGKGKGKGKGGAARDEARPVVTAPGQQAESHVGPISVPAGTEVRGELKERILQLTGVRVNCRARKSFEGKGLTLAGPAQNLSEALRLVSEAMLWLGLTGQEQGQPAAAAAAVERQDPPQATYYADWQWGTAWWWWQKGYWHGSSSSDWQNQVTEDESRWSWRRPVARLAQVPHYIFARLISFGL